MNKNLHLIRFHLIIHIHEQTNARKYRFNKLLFDTSAVHNRSPKSPWSIFLAPYSLQYISTVVLVRKRRKQTILSIYPLHQKINLEFINNYTGSITHHELQMSTRDSQGLQSFIEIQLCEVKQTFFYHLNKTREIIFNLISCLLYSHLDMRGIIASS